MIGYHNMSFNYNKQEGEGIPSDDDENERGLCLPDLE